MKVQSKNLYYSSREIRMGNENVKWGKDAVAEVSDKLGKELISGFDFIYPAGQVPKDVVKPKAEDDEPNEELEEAIDKIAKLQIIVKRLEGEKKNLLEDLKVWKGKFQELEQEPTSTPEEKVEPKDLKKEENEEDEVQKSLMSKTVKELKEIAAELEIKEEDVSGNKNKIDWVNVILSKDE